MTKEEFIAKLQMVYIGDRNAFNELVCIYNDMQQRIKELENINDKLSSALESAESKNSKTIDMIGLILRDIEENNVSSKEQDLIELLVNLQGKEIN